MTHRVAILLLLAALAMGFTPTTETVSGSVLAQATATPTNTPTNTPTPTATPTPLGWTSRDLDGMHCVQYRNQGDFAMSCIPATPVP
jgi:hypothetical protein